MRSEKEIRERIKEWHDWFKNNTTEWISDYEQGYLDTLSWVLEDTCEAKEK